jgi:hypothetical protein
MTWGGGYHRALLYQQHFADAGAAAMVAPV